MDEKTKIQELYENEKSKKFVNHLIQAYLPLNKPEKIFEFKHQDRKKCSVCGQSLISVEEALHLFHSNQDEMMKYTTEKIKKIANNEEIDENDNPFKEKLNGRILGWKGKNTDTFLCSPCIQDLSTLVEEGLLSNDKNIIWLINKMKRDDAFNGFQKSKNLNNKDKQKANQLHKKADKRKKVTFGDLSELQELKKKMEQENQG